MAIGSLLVASGVLLVRPAHGVVAVLVSGTVGGVQARCLLPLAIFTPFLLGWLRIEGERLNLYESSFGVALTSVAYVTLFGLIIWGVGALRARETVDDTMLIDFF